MSNTRTLFKTLYSFCFYFSGNGSQHPENYRGLTQTYTSAGRGIRSSFPVGGGGGVVRSLNPQPYNAIDVGLGTAVNLDRRGHFYAQQSASSPASGFQSIKQPEQSAAPSQKPYDQMTSIPTSFPTRLPSNANVPIRGGRIIPIQYQGEMVTPHYRDKTVFVDNLVTTASYTSSQPAPDSYTSYTSPNNNSQQPQPRVVIQEPIHPQPPDISSNNDQDTADHHQEGDDVFDDKMFKKPPSFSTCKYSLTWVAYI